MKIQNYCYTRGDKPDYRDFIIPNNTQGNDITTIRGMVRPVLESELKEPVWILYKTSKIIIWGVCCRNSLLSKQNNTDEKGRAVKGFFSIVLSEFSVWDLRIPYDVPYFERMYEHEVVPNWFCAQGENFSSSGRDFYNGSYRFISASKNEYTHLLNTDIFLAKRLGISNIEEVIASALTFDTITLTIGYDGTDGFSNTNAIFMNSIMPGKKEKSVPVKRACPSCGKLVSHYTNHDICDECAQKAEQDSNPFETDKNINMENKEQELTVLKRQVRDCRLEIEEKDKKIKKQNRQIKILWIICGVLLLLSLWLFKNSNIKIKTDFVSRQSIYQEMAADKHQEPDFFLDVDTQKVEIMAEGQDSVVVGWRTNYSNVEVKMPDVDWVEITHRTKNGLILSIKANGAPNIRVAQIKIKPTDGNFKTIEIHQKSAE